MVKLKEIFKNIFSGFMGKVIIILSGVIFLLLLFGRCNNVKADNFILSDGSESNITYNEGQLLAPSSNSYMSTYRIIYSNNYYAIINSNNSSVSMYNNCTYDSSVATLTCTKMVTHSYPNTTTSPYIFTDNYNFIVDLDKLIVVSGISSYPNTDYFIVPSYQDGYNAGIGDNQETIYNNGYSAGYSAGETAGYNAGYSQGQTKGYQTGFNEGTSEGYDDGKTDGYNEGYAAGLNNADTTIDNQEYADKYIEENNYHSDQEYIAHGNTQYGNGYHEGKNNGFAEGVLYESNHGFELSTCTITGLVNNATHDCSDILIIQNGVLDFTSIYAYLNDNYENINGRFEYDIKLDYYQGATLIGMGTTYDSYGVHVYFYDNDTLVGSYSFIDNNGESVPYIKLTNKLSGQYNRVVFSNANLDYSIKTFGFYEDSSFDKGTNYGKNEGYQQAMKDEKAFLGFIPATLGGVVANVMPILTYEVYGLSIMNLIGLIAMIGIAIIIVKFIVG